MIESAEEFVALRAGFDRDNILRSMTEFAETRVWLDVIARYPRMRQWVAQNTTIPDEISDLLAEDEDRHVRWQVSAKRRISAATQRKLGMDRDEAVRLQLAKNPNTTKGVLDVLATDETEAVRAAARSTLEGQTLT